MLAYAPIIQRFHAWWQAEEWKAAAEEASTSLPLLKLELKRESLLRKKADNR